MGTHYYIVIPKLKILIWVGRNIPKEVIEDEEKTIKDFLDLWLSYNNCDENLPCLSEIKEKKLEEVRVENIMSIAFYISKIENYLCLQNSPCTIIKCMVARWIDGNSYVIPDFSEEMGKLAKRKYTVIDEDGE